MGGKRAIKRVFQTTSYDGDLQNEPRPELASRMDPANALGGRIHRVARVLIIRAESTGTSAVDTGTTVGCRCSKSSPTDRSACFSPNFRGWAGDACHTTITNSSITGTHEANQGFWKRGL
jgi:hypothetical protein